MDITNIPDQKEFDNHELVAFCNDAEAGLSAIIAIHNTTAGPAMGGCRMMRYGTYNEALADVLRLSKGMTYKNIMAGLPYGEGKAVIVADPRKEKTPELLMAFAQQVARFGGRFITGEDVGTTVVDIEVMRRVTSHVRGIPENGPGDPAPMTALGVLKGIETAVKRRLKASDLKGVRIVVQGLGAVGGRLLTLLHEAGATLIVSDIDAERVEAARIQFSATAAPPHLCHVVEADVYAPCALGGTLSERTIADLRDSIIAGAANNQLATAEDGRRLADRGILYAPDYVINAGGVISGALEGPSFDRAELLKHVGCIADTLHEIFVRAEAEKLPTSMVADAMAQERLARARRIRAQKSPIAEAGSKTL
jgi:leucine dehydrogenase